MSGVKDLSLSPSLWAHGYLTLGENAQEEVRGGGSRGRRVGERIEIMGEREEGREGGTVGERERGRERDGRTGRREGEAKESINKGTCTCTCIT